MFHMSWTTPYKGEVKTLRFRKSQDPVYHGFGAYTDIDGNCWDVNMIYTNDKGRFVCARPYNSSEWRYSTSGIGYGGGQDTQFQELVTTWIPYKVELVDDPPAEKIP